MKYVWGFWIFMKLLSRPSFNFDVNHWKLWSFHTGDIVKLSSFYLAMEQKLPWYLSIEDYLIITGDCFRIIGLFSDL